MHKLLTALGIFTVATTASAEPIDRWWSGWSIGTSEYGYSSGKGDRLLISCSDDTGTNIAVQINSQSPKDADMVVFAVDGDRVEFLANDTGGIGTLSRVDSDNFRYLWTKLRSGRKLNVSFGGMSTDLPLTGSSQALYGEPCTTDFDR